MSSAQDSIVGPAQDSYPGRFAITCLILSALVLIVLRMHAFDVPLETDECNYAYIGGRLLEGDRLYVDVWDHQPPGAFMLFAGAIALCGDSPEVFRWLAIAFSLITLALVFAIARRISGDRAAGVAAILFALVCCDPGTAGDGVNREIFMNTFMAASWFVLLRRRKTRPSRDHDTIHTSSWTVFVAGAILGLGSLLKTVVAIHWLALAVWLALATWQSPRRDRRGIRLVIQTLVFGAGPLLIWLATLGYFTVDGRQGDFVDAVFGFNLSYSSGEDALTRIGQFLAPRKHPHVLESGLPLWIASGIALLWSTWAVIRHQNLKLAAIIAMTLASFVAICLPGMFWPHYYQLLVPGCVILVAALVAAGAQRMHDAQGGKWSALAVCAVMPLLLGITEYRDYLGQSPFGITEKRYHSRDFWAKAQGENARSVTDPEDTVFVYGKDVGIYYYSQRRCASRFTMITGLQSAFTGSDRRRRVMIEDLNKSKPRLIFVMADEPAFPEWVVFLHEYYTQPVGWDYHDRTGEPIMFVVARKDRPTKPLDWSWDRSQIGGWLERDKP